MAQQIAEITKVPTNVQVIKILNEVIKRYNSLGSIYTFKGSVQTYDDLLAIQNPQIGDVYNVIQEDEEHQIAAGSNFVWDGTVWDNLGGSLAGLVQSVNGINPDSLGNVLLPLIKNVTAAEGNIVFTKNDNSTVQFNDIKKLYMLALGENVNLNDLTESGIYICTNNANAANYENCPIQKAFLLEVQATVNSNFIFQFLTQYNDGSTEAGNQYIRTYYNNNWSAWRMAGSGSNLTTYTSLEQLGITPGQESFASIHSALPINSVLEYYVSEAQNFADIYPASDGNFIATRLTGDITIFHFTGTNQIMYVTHYHVTNNTNPSWTQIAKQSDLMDYLPLSGGALTGALTLNNVKLDGQGTKNLYINDELIYNADSNNNRKGLELPPRSMDRHGGSLLLKPYTGYASAQIDVYDNMARIIGRNYNVDTLSGELTNLWNFPLKTFDTTTNITVEGVIGKSTNYIKYVNGLLIQMFTQGNVNSGTWITFPLPFKDTNYAVSLIGHDSNGYQHDATLMELATTGVKVYSPVSQGNIFKVIAIGYAF